MKLSDVLQEERIITDLVATEKIAALAEMVDRMCGTLGLGDREAVYRGVLERERLGCTGIGDGVAIPHAPILTIRGVDLVLGISKKGIPYASPDGLPVTLLFLIGTQDRADNRYLMLLAQVARLTLSPDYRRRLTQASTPREALDLVREAEGRKA